MHYITDDHDCSLFELGVTTSAASAREKVDDLTSLFDRRPVKSEMIFNDVFSKGTIIINFVSLLSGLITIAVYRKKWQFVASKKFRKARGTIRLNQTVFLCMFIIIELVVAFGVNRETDIGRNGCFAALSCEAYFVLCLFSWTFNIVSIKEDSFRMLAWPTLEISHMFLVAYISPLVISAIFSTVLVTKTSTFIQCSETALKTNEILNLGKCTIENCDFTDNFQSKILLAALFLLPVLLTIGGYLVEYIRRIRVATVMWRLQEFSFTQIVENYSKRGELQVDLMYLCHHLWLLFTSTVLVFIQQKYKGILKTIFSVTFSSMVSK